MEKAIISSCQTPLDLQYLSVKYLTSSNVLESLLSVSIKASVDMTGLKLVPNDALLSSLDLPLNCFVSCS